MCDKWKTRINDVAWGYRDKFRNTLNSLMKNGYLNLDPNEQAYSTFDKIFMNLVGKGYGSDIVANYFLESLDKYLFWIISIPELMESWGGYGQRLLKKKLYHGLKYFELWNRDMGVNDPSEMRFIIDMMHLVEARINASSSLAFLEGYPLLRNELKQNKLHRFVEEGINMFSEKPKMLSRFFMLELNTAQELIKLISRRCCLKNIRPRLERLFKSICDKDFNIENTTRLDSDELMEKGSTVICCSTELFLPEKVTVYNNMKLNTEWYLGSVYLNAFSHLFNGFPVVHAMPGYESSGEYLRNKGESYDVLSQNLFYIVDFYRILYFSLKFFPGLKNFLKNIFKLEFDNNRQITMDNPSNDLLVKLINSLFENKKPNENNDTTIDQICVFIKEKIINCDTFDDTLPIVSQIMERFSGYLNKTDMWCGIISFYSDYRYNTGLSKPHQDKANIQDAGKQKDNDNNRVNPGKKDRKDAISYNSEKDSDEDEDNNGDTFLGYYYDEWNNESQDYLHQWCCLNEVTDHNMVGGSGKISKPLNEEVKKVRQIFERIKPDLVRNEKNLPDGDDIILKNVINFLVEKKAKLSPEERLYSKFYKQERDIAAALLIDISGSTGEVLEDKEVLEIEKSAAFLLAEGLGKLGDKFGMFGFSGFGKDKCSYYIFKRFEEDWKDEQKKRLRNCRPNGATRIGVAIRHTVEKLKHVDASRKMIILMTDGKPQDSDGYTSEGLYAQYDVRMAGIEAKKNGIVVFCLSTENNSISELELMFPVKRYIVMKEIRELPRLLAKSYIKMTI